MYGYDAKKYAINIFVMVCSDVKRPERFFRTVYFFVLKNIAVFEYPLD